MSGTSFSFPSWLQTLPLVEAVSLELPPPHLNDNTADWDRLIRALKERGFSPLHVEPVALGPFTQAIRRGEFGVTTVLGWRGAAWEVLEVLPGSLHDQPFRVLGASVDVGTTSLVFTVVDMVEGRILAEAAVQNPQVPLGEDILTRILLARRETERFRLQHLLIEAFNTTLEDLSNRHGFSLQNLFALTVAGNTTMTHFLLGLDPTHICREPYIPAVNRFPVYHARDLDLGLPPLALVHVFPNVGSYFGGDLIAGIVAAGMHRSKDISLLVDVGTNAEVVLGNREWLIACAGAAGPALEGGVVERGMMAAPGAIDRVRINMDTLEPTYHVIGGERPQGLCGSGLIDLVAEMFAAGILTPQGKIDTALPSPRILNGTDGAAYVVASADETTDGRDLRISDIDIGIFLKSKAAMYTILSVITRKVGVSFEELRRICIAGTFGNHIDAAMAVRIGMIPDLPLEVYEGVGNTAGQGAAMLLLDRSLLQDMDEICDRITYIELNVNMELMNEFRGALFLPHTDRRLFPSVRLRGETATS